jgi:hypothetical protein
MQNRVRQNNQGCTLRLELFAGVLLDAKVRLRLVSDETEFQVPDNFSGVFLFRPSTPLRQELEREKGYRIEAVDPLSGLWRLAK